MDSVRTDSTSARSVLIVDDDADTRELYSVALSGSFEIHQAGSAQEACELLTSMSPRFILVDISLPDMTGPEFMKHVALNFDLPETKVIFVSGWPDVEDVARRLGAHAGLRKPVDLRALRKLLRTGLLDCV